MAISRRLRHRLVALLAITITLKLIIQGSSAFPTRQDQLRLLNSRLEAIGYQYGGLTDSVWAPTLTVFKDKCVAFIFAISAEGATEDFHRSSIRPNERLIFAYDGRTYPEQQPRWRPILDQQVYKLLRAMQIPAEFPAVYAIRMTRHCDKTDEIASRTKLSDQSF